MNPMKLPCCCCGRHLESQNELGWGSDTTRVLLPLCNDCHPCNCNAKGISYTNCRDQIEKGNYGAHPKCQHVVKKVTADQKIKSDQNLKDIIELTI